MSSESPNEGEPEISSLDEENKLLIKKLHQKDQELQILRQQMQENDAFREEVWSESKQIQQRFKIYEKTIKALNNKYVREKKRCESLQKQQSNYLRKYREQTKKSIENHRDEYFNAIIMKIEKENGELHKGITAAVEERKDLQEKYLQYKRLVKKEKKENDSLIKKLRQQLSFADEECEKIRQDQVKYIEMNKEMRVEARYQKSTISSLQKKIEDYNDLFYSNKSLISKSMGDSLDDLARQSGLTAKGKGKKNVRGGAGDGTKVRVSKFSRKNRALRKRKQKRFTGARKQRGKLFSPQGKLTKSGVDEIINSCLKGEVGVVDEVLDNIDFVEDSRMSQRDASNQMLDAGRKLDFDEVERRVRNNELVL